MIWSTIALSSEEADAFSDAPEDTGLPKFRAITTLNVVMAYLYVIVHVCACPIGIYIVARDPESFGIRVRRPEEMNDDELDALGDSAQANRIRALRRDQADRAMNNLSMGNFTNVASQMVKDDEEAQCVICYDKFTHDDDQVTELECN